MTDENCRYLHAVYQGRFPARAIENLYQQAEEAHAKGATILILTDRGVDHDHLAIPSLLAVAALETYLVRTRKNTAISLIIETAEPCEVHHFATLLGFGRKRSQSVSGTGFPV